MPDSVNKQETDRNPAAKAEIERRRQRRVYAHRVAQRGEEQQLTAQERLCTGQSWEE